jgi:hypothetical protein
MTPIRDGRPGPKEFREPVTLVIAVRFDCKIYEKREMLSSSKTNLNSVWAEKHR